jgi:hypothetical protein
MGGAGVLMTNKPALIKQSKYQLAHSVRIHTGQDDAAYRCAGTLSATTRQLQTGAAAVDSVPSTCRTAGVSCRTTPCKTIKSSSTVDIHGLQILTLSFELPRWSLLLLNCAVIAPAAQLPVRFCVSRC